MCLHRLPELLAALTEEAAANHRPDVPEAPAPVPPPGSGQDSGNVASPLVT